MAAFKRPGELSASAFGLSFADRDAGSAAPPPIYNKNERLALTEQVSTRCLLLHFALTAADCRSTFLRASQQLLPNSSLSQVFCCLIALLVGYPNFGWTSMRHRFELPTDLPHHRHPSCRPKAIACSFLCRSAAGCPSMPTEPSCCI